MKYFRLLPEVYIIKGANHSLLQNLLLKKSLWINSELSYILQECEKNVPFSKKCYNVLKTLENNGWGYITSQPIFIDKLRLYNVFSDKKFYKETPIINSAILHINNDFPLNYKHTEYEFFCSTNIKIKNNSSSKLSLNNWKNIVLKLKKYGCSHITLTGGEPMYFKEILDLVEFIIFQGINVSINTTGLLKINSRFRSIHMNVMCVNVDDINQIKKNLNNCDNVLLLNATGVEIPKQVLYNTWQTHEVFRSQPKIDKNHLVNMDFYSFFLRKRRNKCLYGKISILHNGEVIPCLESYKHSGNIVGNVFNNEWSDIIRDLINNYWLNTIDKKESCQKCEFRYACDSCLFFDVNNNCQYNVEAAAWK